MGGKGEGSWHCAENIWQFCPPEGCPKSYGCARKHGWKLGDPSPDGCTGKVTTIKATEKQSVKI